MTRRLFSLLLCLIMLVPAALAEDFDGELEITEILESLPEEQDKKSHARGISTSAGTIITKRIYSPPS